MYAWLQELLASNIVAILVSVCLDIYNSIILWMIIYNLRYIHRNLYIVMVWPYLFLIILLRLVITQTYLIIFHLSISLARLQYQEINILFPSDWTDNIMISGKVQVPLTSEFFKLVNMFIGILSCCTDKYIRVLSGLSLQH
jgi:hypothetical protein